MENNWGPLMEHEDHELDVHGVPLIVQNNVFTPNVHLTNSSDIILRNLPDMKGKNVLDMGCGTGVLGVLAARHGAKKIFFSDISDQALENTKVNLSKHKLTEKSVVVKSDLFENIPEKFDCIIANLPILEGFWNTKDSTKTIAYRFLKECKNHVNKNGIVLFAWASFSDVKPVRDLLDKLKYDYSMITETALGFEWHLFRINF